MKIILDGSGKCFLDSDFNINRGIRTGDAVAFSEQMVFGTCFKSFPLPLLATCHDDSFGVGVYPVFLRPATSHDPCYLVTVDEQELSLLIKEVHLLVCHVVAEELASAAHAEGSEGVAWLGCAHGQWP